MYISIAILWASFTSLVSSLPALTNSANTSNSTIDHAERHLDDFNSPTTTFLVALEHNTSHDEMIHLEQISTSSVKKSCREIVPASYWMDTKGKDIHAHGGQVLKSGNLYYWVGESEKQTFASKPQSINLYSSSDLKTWTFVKEIFNQAMISNEFMQNGGDPIVILERPKIAQVDDHGENFVLLFHADDKGYNRASIGYALSTTGIAGPYQFQRLARPDGNQESRDLGIYQEGDQVYLLYTSNSNNRLVISHLVTNQSLVTIGLETRQQSFIDGRHEAPAMVKLEVGYMLLASSVTWWFPNSGAQFYSPSLQGPWTRVADLAPWYKFFSQPSFVVPLGTGTNSWIYMSDRWKWPFLSWASYVWQPLPLNVVKKAGPTTPLDLSWRDSWCLEEVLID